MQSMREQFFPVVKDQYDGSVKLVDRVLAALPEGDILKEKISQRESLKNGLTHYVKKH